GIGGFGAFCACDHNHQVFGIRLAQLANFRNGLGKRLLQALDVLEDFGVLALAKHRLDLVAFFARKFADLGNDDGDNRQLGIDVQRLQVLGRKRFAHVGHRSQAQVGLVNAVQANRLVVAHLRERRLQVHADGRERGLQEAFNHAEDRLRPRKTDLQIDLGELRLAVGAQIFVAEAARNLKILIEARDHKDLLKELRRFRQRVKFARIHAAGHQVVARAFGGRARHERGLNLVEALRVEMVANGDGNLVAKFDVVMQLWPAQVDIAILQAHLFVGQHGIAGRERQGLAIVQDAQLVGNHLDFAGGNVLVDRVGLAQLGVADDRHHKLGAHRSRAVVDFGPGVGGDHNLCDPAAVAQVEEDEIAEIAPLVHPSHEHNFGAGVGGAQLAAHMSTLQVTLKIEHTL